MFTNYTHIFRKKEKYIVNQNVTCMTSLVDNVAKI
ncbi:unnamed protein product [Schistosoma curassoni]|uniref:Transposase n=1 Tax=Schistosoma curassoni TaxID=6186 RepID=A0A183KWF3_9TREM|nr:unnamed protein product [Schistosoma curassoni]